MKNKFSTHIAYFWWMYVLIAVVFACVWSYSIEARLMPQDDERLNIYVFGKDVEKTELSSQLKDNVLPQVSKQTILDVTVANIYDELYDHTVLHSLLYARGQECDFMIVEETLTDKEQFASSYYFPVDENAVTNALGNVEFWRETVNGKEYAYGILLYDGKTDNNFSQYYNGKNKCWLFFCFKTVNMGGVVGQGNAHNDAALQTIKWLLQEAE